MTKGREGRIIAFPRDAAYGAAKRALQGMVESLYYEMKPFGVKESAMIPSGTNTPFKTPLNDTEGWRARRASTRVSAGRQQGVSRAHRSH